tara:strand:- start:2110 stop:3447 length:1338 start_codon:yes stop_codon:yes gene_type:complete
MGKWQEDIDAHLVWGTLSELEARLDEIDGDAYGIADDFELLTRIDRVVRETQRRLKATDALLLSIPVLNAVNKHATPLLASMQAYGPDAGQHLAGANSNATGLLGAWAAMPSLETPQDVTALGESISSFRRSLGQHVRRANDDVAELERKLAAADAEVDSLTKELENQRERVSKFLTDGEERLNTAETQRADSLRSAITEASDRTESRLKEFSDESNTLQSSLRSEQEEAIQEFRTKLADRKQEWTDGLTAKQLEFTEALAAAKSELEEQATAHKTNAANQIKDLEAQKKKAAELVGIVANTSMAGGYMVVADAHQKETWFWSAVTIAVLGGLMYFSLNNYDPKLPFDVYSFLRKSLVTVPFLLFAAYAAQQGTRSRKLGSRNRRYQLEMASLDPFLASLEVDKQNEIKVKLADRLFGKPEPEEAETAAAKNTMDFAMNLIKKFK